MDSENSISYNQEVLSICGKEHLEEWLVLQPKVYYKDGNPYGLMGITIKDEIKYLSSMVLSPDKPFTVGMLKDIKRMYNEGTICLITDDENYHDLIKKTLEPYGFKFNIINGNLISFGGSKWQ